jgi:hypothetical protein
VEKLDFQQALNILSKIQRNANAIPIVRFIPIPPLRFIEETETLL